MNEEKKKSEWQMADCRWRGRSRLKPRGGGHATRSDSCTLT